MENHRPENNPQNPQLEEDIHLINYDYSLKQATTKNPKIFDIHY